MTLTTSLVDRICLFQATLMVFHITKSFAVWQYYFSGAYSMLRKAVSTYMKFLGLHMYRTISIRFSFLCNPGSPAFWKVEPIRGHHTGAAYECAPSPDVVTRVRANTSTCTAQAQAMVVSLPRVGDACTLYVPTLVSSAVCAKV